MAQIDASIDEPTPVQALADRADIYRIAAALLTGTGLMPTAEPGDVLSLAEFLAGGDF